MKSMNGFAVIVSAICFAGSAIAAPTIVTLDNGMEVMLVENHGNPVIASVVVVRTGLRNETVELNGATHFLEHLLFNGTETRTQKQLYDDMDFLGGYNNANTAHDRTTFMILLEKSNFEKGLEIQADMLFHSILPPDKFEKEKGIVTEEIGKDEDGESYRVSRFFDQVLFAGTPYQWPILGSRQSIRRLSRDQVWQYYKKYYAPNNMAALLMGDFNTAEMIKTVERIFGQEAPGTLPPREKLELSSLAAANEAQSQILVNQGETSSHYIRVNLPGPTRSSPDYFPFIIMTQFLSTQLQEDLQKSPNLGVTGVSASHFVDRDFGVLQMDVTLDAKVDYEPVLKAFHNSALAFADRKFTPEEVAATVTSTRAEEVFNSERPHYYGMMKAEDLAQGGAYFVQSYAEQLAAVTAADVEQIAQKYLGPTYPLVTVYQALSKEDEEAKAEAGRKSVSKIFSNGLTAVVEQNRDSEVFAAHFLFKNRSAYELALGGKPGMVDFIHHIFDYGPEGFGKEEFQQELKRLGAQPKFYDMAFIPYDDYYTTPEFSYVRIEALDENYSPVLDLISCTLADPSFSPDAIEATRGQMMGQAKRGQASVPEKGKALFKKLLYGDSPLAASVTPTAQSLATFDAEALRAFQKSYFSPENLILTILTSQDADSVMAQVEKTIGSW
ncbi:MAG TPA: insulinase family protein, partial [bacterium]